MSSRPENGAEVFTIKGLHAFFTQWLEQIEQFHDERNRRYEDRFKAADEKTALALAASEKAVTKAETATEKRFEGVNEFRQTLSDQAQGLISKPEAVARFSNIDEKIDEIKKEIAGLRESRSEGLGGAHRGRADQAQSNWTTERVIAVIVIAVGVIQFLIVQMRAP